MLPMTEITYKNIQYTEYHSTGSTLTAVWLMNQFYCTFMVTRSKFLLRFVAECIIINPTSQTTIWPDVPLIE